MMRQAARNRQLDGRRRLVRDIQTQPASVALAAAARPDVPSDEPATAGQEPKP